MDVDIIIPIDVFIVTCIYVDMFRKNLSIKKVKLAAIVFIISHFSQLVWHYQCQILCFVKKSNFRVSPLQET